MNKLDRLLDISSRHGHDSLSPACEVCVEIISLKKEIQGLIEKGKRFYQVVKQIKYAKRQWKFYRDKYYGTIPDNYIHIKREDWDKIIQQNKALKIKADKWDKINELGDNTYSRLLEQREALTEQVKELQEEQEAFLQFNGCESFIQLQGKIHQQFSDEAKLQEQVKQLQEDKTHDNKVNTDLLYQVTDLKSERDLLHKDIKEKQDYLTKIWAERDQLKSKIEKMLNNVEWTWKESPARHSLFNDDHAVITYAKNLHKRFKEILGENDKK